MQRILFYVVLVLAGGLVACGGGSSGAGGTDEDRNLPDSIAAKVGITGASTETGDLPEKSELESAPSVSLAAAQQQNLIVDADSTEDLSLSVSVDDGSVLQAMLAKIVGSSSFFQLDTEGLSRKRVGGKAVIAVTLTLNLPRDLTADNFCLDLTARDDALRVARPQRVCFGLPQNNPAGPQPQANAGPLRRVRAGEPVQLTGSGISPDASVDQFSWTQIAGPTVATTGADSSVLSFVAPTLPVTSTLTFELTITDARGRSARSSVDVLVRGRSGDNEPPIAEAGPDRRIDGGLQATLRGDAFDPDGGIATRQWTQLDGQTVSLSGASTATAQFIAPDVSEPTPLLFRFSVTDDAGAQADDTVTITVRPGGANANVPPVANAGPDQNVAAGAAAVLSGGGSEDPDGNIASFSWNQISGPQVQLANANTSSPSFSAPPGVGQSLVFRLLVSDNQGATASDSVRITIVEAANDRPPVADAGPDQTVPAGSLVQLDGSASFDQDGGMLSFEWLQIGGPPVTLAGADSEAPSFTAPQVAEGTVISIQLNVTNERQRTVSDQVAVTIGTVSGPQQHVVAFTDAAQNALESVGTANVLLRIEPVSNQAFSVPYTLGGTAINGSDYVIPDSPLLIGAGASSATLSVSLIGDTLPEGDETVILTLGDPSSGQLGGITQHTLTIADDDTAGMPPRTILAITDEYQLLRFRSDNPASVTVLDLTGIEATQPDNSLPLILDIDRRPATGEIFLLTSDHRFYRLNPDTGVASLQAMIGNAVGGIALVGLSFDPCTDQIRVLGENRENIVLTPAGGLVANDTALAFAPGDSNEGFAPGLDSIAYTDCAQGDTTAFVIDSTRDLLTTLGNVNGSPQPPSSGRLFTVAGLSRSIGGAGALSLDIFGNDTRGFGNDSDGTNTELVAVDLATGTITNLGRVVSGNARTAISVLAVLE